MAQVNQKENKEGRFKRIASQRTQRVLDDLRLLGNCSNIGTYEYNPVEISKIFRAIDTELRNAKMKFGRKSKEEKFKL